jgi:hypothetical protein
METPNLKKELAPIQANVLKAEQAATQLFIKTDEDNNKAAELLIKIKTVGKQIKDAKEKITKPANEILKNARAFFSPMEKQFDNAEFIVKGKMGEYKMAQDAKALKETQKIEAKVEAGKMSFEKAAEKIEAVTPQKSVETKSGGVQYRTIKEVILEDESKLPREYLVPDMVKIRKVALAGVEIAGVKVVDKQVVAGIIK